MKAEQKEVNVYVITLDKAELERVGYIAGRTSRKPSQIIGAACKLSIESMYTTWRVNGGSLIDPDKYTKEKVGGLDNDSGANK